MVDRVRWESPPIESRNRRGRGANRDIATILNEISERPGEWAVVKSYVLDRRTAALSWARNLRLKNNGYETLVGERDGEARVYVRYVGTAPTTEPEPDSGEEGDEDDDEPKPEEVPEATPTSEPPVSDPFPTPTPTPQQQRRAMA